MSIAISQPRTWKGWCSVAKRTPDPKDDRREDYKLAITMLRQLEASPELCDACALEELRTGKTTPQDNIVYRYLVKCRARSLDAQAMHGAAVAVF